MSVGDYAIANDLLGVVVSVNPDTYTLKDSEGNERLINKDACRELVSSFALSASIYVKLRRRANSAKTQS